MCAAARWAYVYVMHVHCYRRTAIICSSTSFIEYMERGCLKNSTHWKQLSQIYLFDLKADVRDVYVNFFFLNIFLNVKSGPRPIVNI